MDFSQNIFISYASKEEEVAWKLCEFLEEKGLRCFFAPRNIKAGEEYAAEIIKGIDESQYLVLILSKASNESPHVLREIERAVSKKIPILVYKIEDVALTKSFEYFLMASQWLEADHRSDFDRIFDTIFNEGKIQSNDRETEKGKNPQRGKRKWLPVVGVVGGLAIAAAGIFGIRAKLQSSHNPTDKVLNLSAEEMEVVSDYKEYEVGDAVFFGTYYDEPIEWRIIRLTEDGCAVLVSKDILTFKAFDMAESGVRDRTSDGTHYDYQTLYELEDEQAKVECRGNSDWESSTIRAWLNSDSEVVSYTGAKPTSSGACDGTNSYDKEPGFLNQFEEGEKAALVTTRHSYEQSAYMGNDIITCEDKVYLLSVSQAEWFDEAGVSKYAAPTEAALAKQDCVFYNEMSEVYQVSEWYWWTLDHGREIEGQSGGLFSESTDVMLFGLGYKECEEDYICASAYVGVYGVRPAVTVDLRLLPKED